MKKLIALLAFVAISISCNTDDSNMVDINFQDTPRVVGFLKTTQNVAFFADEGVVQKEFPFDVLGTGDGAPYNEDITLTYTVDASSTAVAGLEFDWVGTGSQVVIPAGTSFGMLPLDINTGNFNLTAKTTLVLNITAVDKDGFVISDQNKQLKINFIGCLSLLNATYTVVVTRGDGVSVTRTNEVVSLIDVNTFRTTTTATYTVAQLSPPAPYGGFEFIDICGDIQVEEQNLGGYYSNTVKGLSTTGQDGLVTGDNFKVTYEVSFATGNQIYTGVYTRN